MIHFIKTHLKGLTTLIFAIAVFLYWLCGYTEVLSYQEQLQMFLFTPEYLTERLARPGGMADYIGEFITQFHFVPPLGAALLALLFALLQRQVWRVARRNGAAGTDYALTFLPVVALWLYMGDESVMLSLPVALSAALAVGAWRVPQAARPVITLLFYWLFGPVVFVLIVLLAVADLLRRPTLKTIAWAVAQCVWAVAVILITAQWLQYPLPRLFSGIGYYRFPTSVPMWQTAVCLLFAIVPPLLGRVSAWRWRYKAVVEAVVVIVPAIACHPWCYDRQRYDLIEYDYLVRINHWQAIISKAEKHSPDSPMGVAALNLALSRTGQLGDRMFQFYQNGTGGLLPPFARDFTSPLITAEAYYRLGMVNTAMRYMFEAQEAIPNFSKSARMTRRIAEVNIINGQYRVARKYLRMLGHTLFYRSWAADAQKAITDKAAFATHREWVWLREARYTKDFLFSDRETDQMLGLLLTRNPKNKMAFEYLMAYELLNKNLTAFARYYPLGRDMGYNHIPRHYQEALTYLWTQQHSSFQGMPWSIAPAVCDRMTAFARLYVADSRNPQLSQPPFNTTYWSYLLANPNNE